MCWRCRLNLGRNRPQAEAGGGAGVAGRWGSGRFAAPAAGDPKPQVAPRHAAPRPGRCKLEPSAARSVTPEPPRTPNPPSTRRPKMAALQDLRSAAMNRESLPHGARPERAKPEQKIDWKSAGRKIYSGFAGRKIRACIEPPIGLSSRWLVFQAARQMTLAFRSLSALCQM